MEFRRDVPEPAPLAHLGDADWSSGSFRWPLNIVPPRLARRGVNLDW
jgi:hypothetical protein